MWDKIKQFNEKYYREIAWFFIGWFTLDALLRAGKGEWSECALSLLLVAMNVWLYWKEE